MKSRYKRPHELENCRVCQTIVYQLAYELWLIGSSAVWKKSAVVKLHHQVPSYATSCQWAGNKNERSSRYFFVEGTHAGKMLL